MSDKDKTNELFLDCGWCDNLLPCYRGSWAVTTRKNKFCDNFKQAGNLPVCKNCYWHQNEDISDGYICVNAESHKCTEYTDDGYSCDKWEVRKEDAK
jgi:hypothetical protein